MSLDPSLDPAVPEKCGAGPANHVSQLLRFEFELTKNCIVIVITARVRFVILGYNSLIGLSLLHWNATRRLCTLRLNCEHSQLESIRIVICFCATLLFLAIAVFVFVYTKLREFTKLGGSSCDLHTEYKTFPRVRTCNISGICRSNSELASKNFKKCQSCGNQISLSSAFSQWRSDFLEKCISEGPH